MDLRGAASESLALLCCSAVRGVLSSAGEGRHGGEATVEAAELVADFIRQRNCSTHPRVMEVRGMGLPPGFLLEVAAIVLHLWSSGRPSLLLPHCFMNSFSPDQYCQSSLLRRTTCINRHLNSPS